jgi:hypothetical protein
MKKREGNMNRMRWITLVLGAAIVLLAVGCSRQGRKAAPAAALPPGVVLPEWAPKNPSPEFVRAARVLKPVPPEMFGGANQSQPAVAAMLQRYSATFPALYEFFGTFTDEQIDRFLSTKTILVPVKSLTTSQRTALNNWFEAFRKAMQGGLPQGAPPEMADYLLVLYKAGAKEDLSNVEVGFDAAHLGAGHMVHIYFAVKQPDGKVNDFGTAFATL